MSRLRWLAIAAALILWIASVQANDLPVDLELIIAIDASPSVDSHERWQGSSYCNPPQASSSRTLESSWRGLKGLAM
jgi:hypothetical protein